ncbi:DUF1835 domain-containing protein [Neobacillus novalis]|uniref:DUF1835 domain-containing protein n=1 Tax=Neobacillus novalis TaxID=220687 RepID=A0AA95MSW3_9BACI|nr:DUF1835 domain-containing protein [Neobacillus novalis]WHY87188.1 DUF1835 domain-containing protein [Neobacillus novalis]
MKSREDYPFIYFFAEPNVVFVYKIEDEKYLTVSELSERGEWTQFEINHEDEFEIFNHEEWKPLEGRGYSLRLDDTNFMVGEINQLIQNQRKSRQKKDRSITAPVHLVSSASAAGALRFGLAQPKTVIEFDGFFSIGPIWKLESKIGQARRNEWLNENINSGHAEYERENNFTNTLLELEDLPANAPIYIWYANNGGEQTGIRFILHLLREKANQIFLMNTTELYQQWLASNEEIRSIVHTDELDPEQLTFLFEKNKAANPLSQEERIQFQREWEVLAESKGVLRLWQNGAVTEVPEQYYDLLIINTIEQLHREQEAKDFIRTGRVIGEILHHMYESVGDSYLEYRIRHLVYSGVLELKGIPKSMRHYSVKLRDR